MSDITPAFESPSFSNEEDDEFEDDLVDELDDEAEDGDEDDADDDDEGEVEVVGTGESASASANRLDGGAAKAVAEHVARSIVDDPEAVVVDVASDRAGVRLSLHVAPGDMGRIIGKRGRVAQALRSLVRAAAAKDGTDASVDIVD
ncbi:MAG TPA: KH domain-containing protein [Acidimicrobiales bacterium]